MFALAQICVLLLVWTLVRFSVYFIFLGPAPRATNAFANPFVWGYSEPVINVIACYCIVKCRLSEECSLFDDAGCVFVAVLRVQVAVWQDKLWIRTLRSTVRGLPPAVSRNESLWKFQQGSKGEKGGRFLQKIQPWRLCLQEIIGETKKAIIQRISAKKQKVSW